MFDLMCSYRKNTWNMKTVKNMNLTMRHIRIKMKVHKCTVQKQMIWKIHLPMKQAHSRNADNVKIIH